MVQTMVMKEQEILMGWQIKMNRRQFLQGGLAGLSLIISGCGSIEAPDYTPERDTKKENVAIYITRGSTDYFNTAIGFNPEQVYDGSFQNGFLTFEDWAMSVANSRIRQVDTEDYEKIYDEQSGSKAENFLKDHTQWEKKWHNSPVSKLDNVDALLLTDKDFLQLPKLIQTFPYGKIDILFLMTHGSPSGGTAFDRENLQRLIEENKTLGNYFSDNPSILFTSCWFGDTSIYETSTAELFVGLFQRPVIASKSMVNITQKRDSLKARLYGDWERFGD